MLLAALCVVMLSAAPGNLVANAGFEAVRGAMPVRWDLFVMPREGCYGEAAHDEVYEGAYSAKLHNGTAYDKEPANNWSQSIRDDLRNQELDVTGWIKTAGGAEAALWVQCFQRRPLRILTFESTGTRTPVFGDTDWREVEMRVSVPNETDFIMIRCVLLGEGTAWFDSISVTKSLRRETEPDISHAEPQATERTRPADPAVEQAGAAESGAAVEELRASRQALVEANRSLRELNTALLGQMSALQTEVERLREEVLLLRQAAPQESSRRPAASAVPMPELPVPPLVPHAPRPEKEAP